METVSDEIMHALIAADNSDLWQEDDGSTREYAHEYFGFSDYLRDLTGPAHAAADAGLIELRGAWRRWTPTAAGLDVLARANQRSRR